MSAETRAAAFYSGGRAFAEKQAVPQPPKAGEVAIRIAYCGICGTDMYAYHGNMDARVGLNRVVGHEMSGIVDSLGPGVTGLSPGQKVVVRPQDHCGACPACAAGHVHICHKLKFLGLDTDGAMQEIWTVPAHTLHILPDDLCLDHAALIEPLAVTAPRARIVMVAIHAQKPDIDLFQFFWRELKLIRARVYEPEDYETAITTILSGGIDAETIITDVSPLADIQNAFDKLDSSPTAMKNLIKVGELT